MLRAPLATGNGDAGQSPGMDDLACPATLGNLRCLRSKGHETECRHLFNYRGVEFQATISELKNAEMYPKCGNFARVNQDPPHD